MTNPNKLLVLLLAGGVTACAVAPPAAPTIAAMPGAGKNFDQFVSDDSTCRSYASSRIPGNSVQTSQQNSVGTAVAGTAIGAAAGALIGAAAGNPGAGAAIGAGGGLLAGTAVAADQTGSTAYNLQYQYDIAYAQCMAAKGNRVPNVSLQPPPPNYGPYYYAPGYYDYPPVYFYGSWGGRGRFR